MQASEGEVSLPDGLPTTLFWDMPGRSGVPRRIAIERVLNFGRDDEVRWLLSAVSDDDIRAVLRTSHELTPKAARFWGLVLSVPESETRALALARKRRAP